MAESNMVSMMFHKDDWELIREALDQLKSNAIEALQYYAGKPVSASEYNADIERATNLNENIKRQLEIRLQGIYREF